MNKPVVTLHTHDWPLSSDESRGVNRDSFAVSFGGFDTHSDLKYHLNRKFASIGPVLRGFRDELASLGLWDGVTIVITR